MKNTEWSRRDFLAVTGQAAMVSLAGSAVAWVQGRRFSDLAQSYAIASQDIAAALSLLQGIDSEQRFSSFVGDAENAISREHTLWVARRDE